MLEGKFGVEQTRLQMSGAGQGGRHYGFTKARIAHGGNDLRHLGPWTRATLRPPTSKRVIERAA